MSNKLIINTCNKIPPKNENKKLMCILAVGNIGHIQDYPGPAATSAARIVSDYSEAKTIKTDLHKIRG